MPYPLTNWADDEALRTAYRRDGERSDTREAVEPTPIRCAGCGARLGDLLGDLVVVRSRVRRGQTKVTKARGEVEITCPCGAVWRSEAA